MFLGYIYVYSAIIIFSSIEVISKFIGSSIGPLNLWLFRMIFAIFVFSPFVKRKTLKNLSLRDWLNLLWLGVFAIGIGTSLFHIGLTHISAAEVAIVFSSNPLFVLLFSVVIYKERFPIRVYLGMALGFIAAIITSYIPGQFSHDLYALYIIIAAILFALYTVVGRSISQKTSSATLNGISFGIGIVTVLCLIGWLHNPIRLPFKAIPYVAYLGIIATGVAYLLFFKGVQKTSASLGSMAFFVKPWLAAFLAFLILGEKFTLRRDIGGALMALSLIMAYWPSKRSIKS